MTTSATRSIAQEENPRPSLAHLPLWTYIALAVIITIVLAILFYLLSACYSSSVNPPLPSETKKSLRYSQDSFIHPPEPAFTLDRNLIPFYEPWRPPLCTKVTPSDPKLSPIVGSGQTIEYFLHRGTRELGGNSYLKRSGASLKSLKICLR